MSINDAMERGFLTGDQAGEYITSKAVKETRSFTITGALDPNTGRKVRITVYWIGKNNHVALTCCNLRLKLKTKFCCIL